MENLEHDWQRTAYTGAAIFYLCARCGVVKAEPCDGRETRYVYKGEEEDRTKNTSRPPDCQPEWFVAGRERRRLAALEAQRRKRLDEERRTDRLEDVLEGGEASSSGADTETGSAQGCFDFGGG